MIFDWESIAKQYSACRFELPAPEKTGIRYASLGHFNIKREGEFAGILHLRL
jgi:hypothetical protein